MSGDFRLVRLVADKEVNLICSMGVFYLRNRIAHKYRTGEQDRTGAGNLLYWKNLGTS